MVLFPAEFKRSKSLRKSIRTGGFSITQNRQFEAVIRACAEAPRPDQLGTWITEEMVQAYVELHRMRHAHSVEVWYHDELVGGLYGIDLPEFKVFCGESMFSKRTDASKVGFSFLVASLLEQNYKLIDCQMYTDHLASLGAKEIARQDFLGYLKK
jgi:leucyl/phenylalanyl-tRNA--protein transferase